jgi:hypothetical protein
MTFHLILKKQRVLFAYDTNIIIVENESILQHEVNAVMNELQSWFYTNSLLISTKKTIAMSFCTRQEELHLNYKFNLMGWVLPINQKQNSWAYILVKI